MSAPIREGQHCDKKSLRLVSGPKADWAALTQDCVCFANAQGGTLWIGVENEADQPPPEQRIPIDLLDRMRKRIGELTVNVQVMPSLVTATNGGQCIELRISRSVGVASTSDGRYYVRIGDTCQPLVGDDVLRLADERPGFSWEAATSLHVSRAAAERSKQQMFVARLRSSDRVKLSVREKSVDELLTHYGLAAGEHLTNLGVLLLGTTYDRTRLGTAPAVQFLKYDELGKKVNKLLWDDYTFSPIELVEEIWRDVPDFRESYEIPEGLLRSRVPAFDERVIRELLVNALVHRPYTQRGDIFLNLHPDRLEVSNPGRLPLGVTPQNILHASRRRNDGLARIFHDLQLMEKEGSGFDLIYDCLLSSGRPAPVASEGVDSVRVTITRRILKPEVIHLMAQADERFQLSQRERIALGALAQTEGLTARELSSKLELASPEELRPWLGRLMSFGLVENTGKTQATHYFVAPQWLRNAQLDEKTTLSRIHPHRLRALVLEDLDRYPDSALGDLHRRIGPEISARGVKRALTALIEDGIVEPIGTGRWRKYRMLSPQS